MLLRNVLWPCGARGGNLMNRPYRSGIIPSLLSFDERARKRRPSPGNFHPKPGDILYLCRPKPMSQHLFMIGSLDKTIVEERDGSSLVLNDDGSLASSITFTSVDGGQDDGDGYRCQGLHRVARAMKLDQGRFPDFGRAWPFPDGRVGRPIHTLIDVGAMKDRFTGEVTEVGRLV